MLTNPTVRKSWIVFRVKSGAERRSAPTADRCRGSLLIEVVVSLVLLGTVFQLLVPTLGVFQKQRRIAAQWQTALEEASNLLEAASQWPWERITQENLQVLAISEPARRLLPEAEIGFRLVETASPPTRQVTLEIHWQDDAGNRVAPVRLTGWMYRRQEVRP